MRLPALASALLVALACAAPARATDLPTTPAGERLREFFDVIAANDGAKAENFAETSIAAPWRERVGVNGLMRWLESTTDTWVSFDPVSVDSSAPHAIVVTARTGHGLGPVRVRLATEDAAPWAIVSIGIGNAPTPGLDLSPTMSVRPSMPDTHALVDSLASALRAHYVDADTGAIIADHLLAREKSSAYADARDLSDLAMRLMADMRAAHPDKHLWVLTPGGPEPGPGPGGPEDNAPNDFGFAESRVLDGNVGYLKITRMVPPTPPALDALRRAMATLRGVRATIVDVRGNWGGAGGMNAYLWGYFADRDSVPTLQVWSRATGQTVQNWSRHALGPGPPKGAPLYVLTDSVTISAAEAFAFWLQQSGRARVVGERTAGGGHNVARIALAPGFDALISTTRVSYPGTGREWEGVGVAPDVVAQGRDALSVAQGLARRAPGPASRARP